MIAKKWLIYLAAAALATALAAVPDTVCAQVRQAEVTQLDSSSTAALQNKLGEYFRALQTEPAEVKCRESDFIIGVCTDSLVRQAVTLIVYRHFITSPVMGDDAVAIHIFDRWISDGTVKMHNDAEYFAARLFAETNRSSLTGCKAPPVELYTAGGVPVTLFGDSRYNLQYDDRDGGVDICGKKGLYSILYFYDTDCAKCKVESLLLKHMLDRDGYNVNLFAVYTGKDPVKWNKYMNEDLAISDPGVNTVHLWDPDMQADLEIKYGVIQTPRIFLVSPDSVIVGRNLDADSLKKLLDILERKPAPSIEYGSDAAMRMFDETFRDMGDTLGCDAVSRVAGHIAARVLSARDTLLYKQMTGDLLYWLTGQRGEAFKCGTKEFIDRYILSRNDIWRTSDDTLKIVSLAQMLARLDSLCPAGKKLPDISVPAYVRIAGKKKNSDRLTFTRLCGLKNAIVIFYTEGCPVCKAEIAAAEALDTGQKIVLIDMDRIWNTDPALAEELMGKFDLSSLPFALMTDRKGRTSRKYISLAGNGSTVE